MITFQKLSERPSVFARLVGVTVDEFNLLHDVFASIWRNFQYETFVKGRKRERSFGGGNKPKLTSTQDKLLFILLYFKLYPLQIVMGMWFGIDESNINRWIHRLTPLMEITLGFKQVLPVRKGGGRPRGRSLDEIIAEYPDLKDILIDGVERPTRRPKNKQKQKDNYSGKKKRHTRKNILLSDTKKGYIHYLGKTHGGHTHDKTAAEEEELLFPSSTTVGADLGFLGYKMGNAHMVLPAKRKRHQELSDTIKDQNRIFSGIRVKIEHGICGVKRSHIVSDTYRNRKMGFDDLSMYIACGLHNFRVVNRQYTKN